MARRLVKIIGLMAFVYSRRQSSLPRLGCETARFKKPNSGENVSSVGRPLARRVNARVARREKKRSFTNFFSGNLKNEAFSCILTSQRAPKPI